MRLKYPRRKIVDEPTIIIGNRVPLGPQFFKINSCVLLSVGIHKKNNSFLKRKIKYPHSPLSENW